MFKKRIFRKKKKDVRRRVIERLPFMPKQIQDPKEIVGVKKRKFIPYGRAMSVISVPPTTLKGASKRSITNLQDNLIKQLLLNPLQTRQNIYEESNEKTANENFNELSKKLEDRINDKLTELESASIIGEKEDISDYTMGWLDKIPDVKKNIETQTQQLETKELETQTEKNIIRTSQGYYSKEDINPVTLQEKGTTARELLNIGQEQKKEEELLRKEGLKEQINYLKNKKMDIDELIQSSKQDIKKDDELREQKTENIIQNQIENIKQSNKELREKLRIREPTMMGESSKIEEEQVIPENIKEQYNEMISNLKELNSDIMSDRKLINKFQDFIDKINELRGNKQISTNFVNGVMDIINKKFNLPTSQFKIQGAGRTLTKKQSDEYRVKNYFNFTKLREDMRNIMLNKERDFDKMKDRANEFRKQNKLKKSIVI